MVANNTDTQKGDIINEHNYNKLLFRLKVLTTPKVLAMEMGMGSDHGERLTIKDLC